MPVCSNRDLTTLTMVTCTIGGTMWLTRFFDLIKRDEISIQDKSVKNFALLADSLSIKVTFSMFYSYLALNVNYALLVSEACTIDQLCVGYATVLGGLMIETVRPHLRRFTFFK